MRWWHAGLVLAASVLIPTCLGGVYAWSTLVGPLHRTYGLSHAQAQSLFGVTIAVFTLTMVIAGRLLPRCGPRILTAVGGLLFGAGYLVAAHANGAFAGLLLGFGVLAGAGIGCAYVSPLTVAAAWFPRQRGLVTGLSVAGMGGGAALLSAGLAHTFALGWTITTALTTIGLLYGTLIAGCGQVLRFPEAVAQVAPAPAAEVNCWRHRPFWGLVFGMGCGTFAGLLVVGNLQPMAESWGFARPTALLAVAIFAAGNALGRIGWGLLADRLGAVRAIVASLILGAVCLGALLFADGHSLIFLLLTGGLAIAFGGCFVLYATQVTCLYGATRLPAVYPWVFLAYGGAALLGPSLGGWLYDTSGSYRLAVMLAAGVCILGALGAGWLLRQRVEDEPAGVRQPDVV